MEHQEFQQNTSDNSSVELEGFQQVAGMLDVNTIEEFYSCESGFLAKKHFLLNWILSKFLLNRKYFNI